jgi:methyl-accepting chemotaxis protein
LKLKLTFRRKLFIPLIISWLCLLSVSAVNIFQNKSRRFEERQLALKFAADVGMSTVKEYAALASSGAMPLADAKQQALARVKAMRYGTDGYITVLDSHPTMLMHPIKSELSGKDMSAFQDLNGQHLFVNVAAIAKGTGEGWLEYVWPKPGHPDQKLAFPKGAYILTYKPWDWTFMTGVYLDDLDEAFQEDLLHAGVLLGVTGIVLTGIIALVIRHIERGIGGEPELAVDVVQRIATGDLSKSVPTRPGDQASLLFAMQAMRGNLLQIVRQVRAGTDAIGSSSGAIAASNLDLSSRTEQQAAALQETAASMGQLTATVRQNTDNARQGNTLAQSASGVAAHGGAVVAQVVDTMASIQASSRQIVDIIAVIDGIAFQTNILALNAAVEAARAGEQGRGFAVVAAEVRNLAQRSATAAKEIKHLIDSSVAHVESGGRLVAEAGATMEEVVSSVQRVTDIMADIVAASDEQSAGIEQINKAIAEMDQVTQQNAAVVEEVAAASDAMRQQAVLLAEAVGAFRFDGDPPPRPLGGALHVRLSA